MTGASPHIPRILLRRNTFIERFVPFLCLAACWAAFIFGGGLLTQANCGEKTEQHAGFSYSYPSFLRQTAPTPSRPAEILAVHGEPKRAYDILKRADGAGAASSDDYYFEARLLTEIGYYERADSALMRACARDSAQWDTYTLLWKTRLNLLAGRHDGALAQLRKIKDPPTTLRPYVQELVFESLVECGQRDSAVALGETILAAEGVDYLRLELWEDLIEIYIAGDSLASAAHLAAVLAQHRMNAEEAARVAGKEIDLLHQLGRTLEAKEKTVGLVKKYPDEASTIRAVRWALVRIPRESLTVSDRLLFLRLLMQQGELTEAGQLLAELGRVQLNPQEEEQRKIRLADLYYREKKYSQAAELARQKFASPEYRRFSMLILARCYRRMGRPLASARLYEDFASAFPDDAKAAEALFVAAGLYERIHEQERAARSLERLADTYPSGYFGHVAVLKLSWQHEERGRVEKSAEILKRTLKRSNRYRETTLYYLAEAYGRMGLPDEREQALLQLAELDSLSFYLNPTVETSLPQRVMSSNGAIELEGEDGLIEFLKEVEAKKAAAHSQILECLPAPGDRDEYRDGIDHMTSARIFFEMGFRDWGEKELKTAEETLRSSKRLLFELAMLYDHYGLTWNSMRWYQYVWDSIHGEDRRRLAESFSLLLYPLPFPVQVFENCARQELPPHLVYAMIRAESGFNRTAVSRAGAMGLMQLMPGTGKDVARRLELPEGFVEDLFSPEINLSFGIWYASFLFEQCGKDPFMMLAAYNAGMTNARRWFRHRREESVPRMVDGITYKETRNYVKKIIESSHVYRNLYFDTGASHGSSARDRG